MLFASLTISHGLPLFVAAAGFGAAILLLVWAYRFAPGRGIRWVCFTLKILAVVALLFCLLEPVWTSQRARPGANYFVLLADNSQGMTIRDPGARQSRGEILAEILDPSRRKWISGLEGSFEVRRYLFDSRLQNSQEFRELDFEGGLSAIGGSLRNLVDRFRGRPLAGILLFTDGNATDLGNQPMPQIPGMPPVYPVVIGSLQGPRDLAIQNVTVSQSAFEDSPVSVQAEVSSSGFADRKVTAVVLDEVGRTVERQVRTVAHNTETISFRFRLKPGKPGLAFYKLFVALDGGALPNAGANQTEEATLANNSRVFVVDRSHGPYRILYVAGRPNWEFKFLNRSIQSDPETQLVGLIRIAKREPKFEFRGRAGESSNPLFRGFGSQAPEEVERYDRPVLMRVNTRDESELVSGFPRVAEDLYAYDAVILDDVEAEFFEPDQATILQNFVSERGGGFLMLGGAESFREGKYERTPIGDLLPVYLNQRGSAEPTGPVRLKLTREGSLQAWARLKDNEADEKSSRDAAPLFDVANRLHEIKPGAMVVAMAVDESGGELPALVVERFGRGSSAALTIGDVWRWGMKDPEARADMEKFWRQMIRWLVSDVPRRIEITEEPQAGDPNGAIHLMARVRDPKFQPIENAQVSFEVQRVTFDSSAIQETNRVRLRAEPSLSESGMYEATYVPRLNGGYRATVFATNAANAEIGRAESGWSTDLAAQEFRSLVPNYPFLRELARRSGGEIIEAGQLEEFVKSLPKKQAPIMETDSHSIWDTPLLFGFALACLLAEWGIRRWKGLP
jgi:uncharacterized membrane protein